MEPYKAKKLPFDYNLSNDMLRLLCEAKEAFGEYKGFLKSMSFDYKSFLEHSFIIDSYYSFKIDGFKIEKDDMFFMPFSNKNNLSTEFNNLKKSLVVGLSNSSKIGFSLDTFNKTHKTIYSGCKKDNTTKGSGNFRKSQTYILKPGLVGSSVSFIPPIYSELNVLMKNLCEYINTTTDESFVSICMSHYQFEKLHPYISGNGVLGRLMMPIMLAFYKNEPPILFLSESFENLKNTYFTLLSENDENYEGFIKFVLECIINQCNINIKRIKTLNKVYKKDFDSLDDLIGGTTIYKVFPVIVKKVVFTTQDLVSECKLHINSVNKVLNKMVDCGLLIKEKKPGTNRVTFCYKNLYNVYVK